MNANGHFEAAKQLANHLLENKFDIAYAYEQLHFDLSHAFWRTLAHLDYDRNGFDYPIIPFHVNSFGRKFTPKAFSDSSDREFSPPSPTPERCFEIGASIAEFFKESPYRAALIGSSSWSHAFLTEKTYELWPDVESDRARYEELATGQTRKWRDISLAQLDDCGQNEMLNWICLAGAMDALGKKPSHTEFIESYIFNSSKAIAIFE